MNSSFKKITAGLLLLAMSVSLAACSGKSTELLPAVPTVQPLAPAEQETVMLPLDGELPYADQQTFIQNRFNDWAMDSSFGAWSYAVTDLDRNGRMEVIALSTQGTGHFSTGSCWELSEDFRSLNKCISNLGEDEFWPELTVNEADCYHDDGGNIYYYIFEDIAKADAATYYTTKVSVSLKNGGLRFMPLCSKTEIFDANGGSDVECYDLHGNLISLQDYEGYADMIYAGFSKSRYSLSWTNQGSTGATAAPQPVQPIVTPAPQPTYQPTPQPTAQPAAAPVVITKNPSSEALSIGGKTWFIAHANNAHTLTWSILSPDGRTYSLAEAMQLHPGLKLEALEGDTIAVSNVPASLNGWGIQARFDGAGGYQTTSPAYIYVGDYTKAYAAPLEKYRNAAYVQDKTAYALNNGISELIASGSSIGYAFKDMDKDGIPELLIGAMGGSDKTLYDLYTLRYGSPVQLACTWYRNRYCLRTDNTLLNSGSSGAAYSFNALLSISGGQLVGTECVFTYPYGNSVNYYYQPGAYPDSPNSQSTLISEAQANAKISEYEAKIYLPPLTKIY